MITAEGFRFSKKTRKITGYFGKSGDVVIPAEIDGIAVEGFDFYNCDRLINVVVSDGIEYAPGFDGCKNLRSVKLPSSVKYIGYEAFHNCINLEKVTMPENLKEIAAWAFWGCKNLRSIELPDSLTFIDSCAFMCCESLTEIRLPPDIRTVGTQAFSHCPGLIDIQMPAGIVNVGHSAFRDTLWLNNNLDDFAVINDILISYQGRDAEVVVPESIKSFAGGAFSENKFIKSVVIPDGMERISCEAFWNCKKLERVTIPESVKYIGYEAFHDTPWYKSLTDEFVIVGDGVLIKYNGSDSIITVPDCVKSISPHTFEDSDTARIKKIILPQSPVFVCRGVCCRRIEYGRTTYSMGAVYNNTIVVPNEFTVFERDETD